MLAEDRTRQSRPARALTEIDCILLWLEIVRERIAGFDTHIARLQKVTKNVLLHYWLKKWICCPRCVVCVVDVCSPLSLMIFVIVDNNTMVTMRAGCMFIICIIIIQYDNVETWGLNGIVNCSVALLACRNQRPRGRSRKHCWPIWTIWHTSTSSAYQCCMHYWLLHPRTVLVHGLLEKCPFTSILMCVNKYVCFY